MPPRRTRRGESEDAGSSAPGPSTRHQRQNERRNSPETVPDSRAKSKEEVPSTYDEDIEEEIDGNNLEEGPRNDDFEFDLEDEDGTLGPIANLRHHGERGISESQESWTQGELQQLEPELDLLRLLKDLRFLSMGVMGVFSSDYEGYALQVIKELQKPGSRTARQLENYEAFEQLMERFSGNNGRWINRSLMRKRFRTEAFDPVFDIANLAAFCKHFFQEHDPSSTEESKLMASKKWSQFFPELFVPGAANEPVAEGEGVDDETFKFVTALRTQVFIQDYVRLCNSDVRLTSAQDTLQGYFFDENPDIDSSEWEETPTFEELPRPPLKIGNHPLTESQKKTLAKHLSDLSKYLPDPDSDSNSEYDPELILQAYPVEQFLDSLSKWSYNRWTEIEGNTNIEELVDAARKGRLPSEIYHSQPISDEEANADAESAVQTSKNEALPAAVPAEAPALVEQSEPPAEPPSSVPTKFSSATSGSRKRNFMNAANVKLLKSRKQRLNRVAKGKQRMDYSSQADNASKFAPRSSTDSNLRRSSQPLSQNQGASNTRNIEASPPDPTPGAALVLSQLEKAKSSSNNKENESTKALSGRAIAASRKETSPKKKAKSIFDRQSNAVRLSFDSQEELHASSEEAPESGQRGQSNMVALSKSSGQEGSEQVPAREVSPLKRKRYDEPELTSDDDSEFGKDPRPPNPARKRAKIAEDSQVREDEEANANNQMVFDYDDNIGYGDEAEEDRTDLRHGRKPRTHHEEPKRGQGQDRARFFNAEDDNDEDHRRESGRSHGSRSDRGNKDVPRAEPRRERERGRYSGDKAADRSPRTHRYSNGRHGQRRHSPAFRDPSSDEESLVDEDGDRPPRSTEDRLKNVRRYKLPRPPVQRTTRRNWTTREEGILIDLVKEYGTSWAFLRDLGKLPNRTDVQLKDKARNIKLEYLRAGKILPRNFDRVTLSQSMYRVLEESGVFYIPNEAGPAPWRND